MKQRTKDLFENLEFLDIVKNSKTLLHLEPDEINGKTLTDLAYLVGETLGEGKHYYSYKIAGEIKVRVGTIRAIDRTKTLDKIENKIEDKTENNNTSFQLEKLNMLLQQQEKIFNLQLDSLRDKISELKKENDELNKIIDEYESEAGKQKSPDLTSLLTTLLSKSNAPAGAGAKLSDNGNGIPKNFIDSLSGVDWSKVSDKQKIEFYNLFEGIKTSLPTK